MVGKHRHLVARFVHGKLGGACENVGQHALVGGVEMLDEDEAHPGVRPQGAEQLDQRLQGAG